MLRLTVLLVALVSATFGVSSASAQALGSNVTVFDPSMAVSEIQAKVDAVYAKQVDAEMGTDRYA